MNKISERLNEIAQTFHTFPHETKFPANKKSFYLRSLVIVED